MSATTNKALRALDALDHEILLADTIGLALMDAYNDNPPHWLHIYTTQVAAIRRAAQGLSGTLHRETEGGGA